MVGAKDGSESRLLGEILSQLIEGRVKGGVARHLDMGRTATLHQAMMMSEIDVYPEYTGTAHSVILEAAPSSDASIVFERVKLDYHNQFRMEWLAPIGFNASFVFVVSADDQRFKDVAAISALAGLQGRARLAVTPAFMNRSDGNASLVKVYGLEVRLVPQSANTAPPLYRALAEGRVDALVGTASDGALAGPRWKILADDKSAFLPNQACLVARGEAFTQHPDLRDILTRLSGKISQEEIRKLNQKVDSGRDAAGVASAFLAAAGLG